MKTLKLISSITKTTEIYAKLYSMKRTKKKSVDMDISTVFQIHGEHLKVRSITNTTAIFLKLIVYIQFLSF